MEVEVQQCMELTNTNRSRAYPKSFPKENYFGSVTLCIGGVLWEMLRILMCCKFRFVSSFQVIKHLRRCNIHTRISVVPNISRQHLLHKCMFGGDGGRVPRVPIPNTTVKPSSADGTWTAGSRESRTSPSEQPKRPLSITR